MCKKSNALGAIFLWGTLRQTGRVVCLLDDKTDFSGCFVFCFVLFSFAVRLGIPGSECMTTTKIPDIRGQLALEMIRIL